MVDEPTRTAVLPTNPTVGFTDIPDASGVNLLFDATPNLIAGLSRSGGVAFYRSGDMTAISGPYGASLTSGDVRAISRPNGAFLFGLDEPSADGGNNDPDFTS